MAIRESSRSARSNGRASGNSRSARRVSSEQASTPNTLSASAAAILAEVRQRLEVASAVAAVTCAALRSQAADADHDAATTLQRHVCDELSRQIEKLNLIVAMCRVLGEKAHFRKSRRT